MAAHPNPKNSRGIAAALVAWHERHGRHDLPWQQDPTPYRVWISEIMLQQTQVATVVDYYRRFMERFPDLASLAAAPLDEVLHLWSGLGYYSRARNLHRAAQVCVAEHGGHLPDSAAGLESLPGIGRSTAAAIRALSANERCAILDGNVRRVLMRCFAIDSAAETGSARAAEQALWRLAEECLPEAEAPAAPGAPGAGGTPAAAIAVYTQAIMDLGATVCVRRRPLCAVCPLQEKCAALRTGRQHEIPAPRRRAVRRTRAVVMLLAQRHDGSVLLERRPERGVWGGLWSPPQFPTLEAARFFGLARLAEPKIEAQALSVVHHAFTHFDLAITPLLARCAGLAGVMDGPATLWYNAAQPDRVGLPAPVSALIRSLS